MPKTKYWKKGLSRRGISMDQLRALRKTRSDITKGRPSRTPLLRVRPRVHPTPPQTKKHGMSMFLREDLEKTEKRLQYISSISSQNNRQSDGENQTENSTNTIADLKHEKQVMKEEITLLKLKIDVLLNMLAQATALTNIQHDELKRLRAQIGKT